MPPSIAEDMLQYAIHPPVEFSNDKTGVTSLASLIQEYVESLLPERFIWHRDAFELKVSKREPIRISDGRTKAVVGESEDAWILEGCMRVGDCVDDEWCVVWLLREISAKWDAAISVWDNDGEFLLIEAADQLPHWVTPENAENRVWIFRSKLHLIPLTFLSAPSSRLHEKSKYARGDDGRQENGHVTDEEGGILDSKEDGWLSEPDALRLINDESENTEATREVQNAVWKRTESYPSSAYQHVHVSKGYIPIDIVKALSQNPSLIQKAVETFYTRDALQLRAAHKMTRFPPHSSVLAPIRLTRTAYAQLVGQKFYPPKVFGEFKEREGTRQGKWRDVGMKIACGFEMLYQESKSRAGSVSADSLDGSSKAKVEALRRDPEYNNYIKRLVSCGYFKGEIESSMLWKELEQKAIEVYLLTRKTDDSTRPSFASLVNTAIARAGDDARLLEDEEEPDDWLNLDAENFDARLEESMKLSKATTLSESAESSKMDVDNAEEDSIAHVQAEKLRGLAKKVEKFVEGEGTLEGALLEDEAISEDGQLSEFSEEEFPSDTDDSAPQAAAASDARQEAMDKLVPPLEPSEYGKMPASFYSNSQKVARGNDEDETELDAVKRRTDRSKSESHSDERTSLASLSRPIRRPILPRDNFDGVDSDDETDSAEDVGLGGEDGDDESDEDRPQVIGDVEIDMEEEEEEFLEFARQSLGIDDKMWAGLLQDRKDTGAFIPKSATSGPHSPVSKDRNSSSGTSDGGASSTRLRDPEQGHRPNANPNLDSFEAVMEAMEKELVKAKAAPKASSSGKKSDANTTRSQSGRSLPKGKGKAVSFEVDTDEEDIEAAMEAELRSSLARGEGDGDDSSAEEEPMDYGMIKNFLESFKSQAGLSGPVSNLAGILEPGWMLPRDDKAHDD